MQRMESGQKLTCVHLTSAHRVDDVRIYHKECVSLANAGHDVHLVAPSTEYEDGERTVDGICIHPVPPPSSRQERFFRTSLHVFACARRLRADIYHLHDPELLPYAVALRLLGHTVVYDVHEDVSADMLSREWIPRRIRKPASRIAGLLESLALRTMSGVVTVTPTIQKRIQRVCSPVELFRNYPIVREFTGSDSAFPYAERKDEAVYVGAISAVRGIYEMLEAVDMLKRSGRQTRLSVAGAFSSPELEASVRSRKEWDYVDFHGWADRHEVRRLMGTSKLGLVVLQPVPNMGEALPVKLFEYMAAGIPVVASDFPLWRSIVEDANCGLLVDPKDPEAIANAMTWVYDHPEEAAAMGRRGRDAVLTTYNWANEEAKLLALYADVTQ